MNAKLTYNKYFLIASLLLSHLLWSQHQQDSSLIYATQLIYENPTEAIEIALKVLNATQATTDTKVESLIVISIAYSSKREYEKSLEYSLKALDLYPKIRDIQLKVKLLNRIGGQYQELNVYDKSITYLNAAHKLMEAIPENEFKARYTGFNNLVRGFIYREQMSCDIALDYFDKAIAAYKKVLDQSVVNTNLSTAYYNRGNCLHSIGRDNDAAISFRQAIDYAKKNNANSLIAFAQKGLASVYKAHGKNKEAITLLTEALQNSEEVGDKVLNRAIYNALADNYLAVANLRNYSLFRNKNLAVHHEIIQTERKTIDNSIKNLIHENAEKAAAFKERNYLFYTIIGIFIVAVIMVIIHLIYKSEKTLRSLKTKLDF